MKTPITFRRAIAVSGIALACAGALHDAIAAGNDIATSPLANRRSSDIKPNIMLIFDDSGSMSYDTMPDVSSNYNQFGPGQRSAQCNTIYYNPRPTNPNSLLSPYFVPRGADGADLNAADPATFTNAYDNGFWAYDRLGTSAGVATRSNLENEQRYGVIYPLTASGVGAYYWTFHGKLTGTATIATNSRTVNGSGTAFTTQVSIGQGISINGEIKVVESITSDLLLTVKSPFSGSGSGMTIIPMITPASGACSTPGTSTVAFLSATALCAANANDFSGTYTVLTSNFSAVADAAAAAATDQASLDAAEASAIAAGNAACAAADPSRPVMLWRKKMVTATSNSTYGLDERQRFANWYSYYRNRMNMAKSALGRAFLPLVPTRKYRVGFITINPQQRNGELDGAGQPVYSATVHGYSSSTPYLSKFLEIRNFDTMNASENQPARWFDILYSQQPNGQTPLREGLSRVGRYYAGKNDGPNAGMIPSVAYDPVQYACQQNFSILTTDGYWNSPSGSIGGFKINYTEAMDNQDGNVAEVDAYGLGLAIGARPVWDGTISQSGTLWDAENRYTMADCTWYLRQTRQSLRYQTVINQTTRQTNHTDSEVSKSTSQIRQRTTRIQSRDKQLKKSTMQHQELRYQIRKSTLQVQKTTTQNTASRWRLDQTDYRDYQTSNAVKMTGWQLETRSRQVSKTTIQNLQTTSVVQKTTVVYQKSTSSPRKTQVQNIATTTQTTRSTDQWMACNGAGLNCQPAQTCTPVPEVRVCQHNVTTNVPVASCTEQTGSSANSYITITCNTSTNSSYVQSCTPQSPDSTNAYVTRSCSNNNFTNQPAESCSAQTGSALNDWKTISCPAAVTTPAANADPSLSCTISGANGTCVVSGTSPDWVHATWTKTTTKTGTSGTCSGAAASVDNSWVATSCFTWNSTANQPVASCTPTTVGGQSRATFVPPAGLGYPNTPATHPTSNVWENTTCATSADSGTVFVRDDGSDCAATPTLGGTPNALSYYKQAPASGNSYKGIYCSYPTGSTTGNQGWPTAYAAHTGATSCNSGTVGSVADDYGNSGANWVHVQCRKTDKTPTNAASTPATCAASQTASQLNSWYDKTCSTTTTHNNTYQIAGPCTAVTNSAVNGYSGPDGSVTGWVSVTTTCNNSVVQAGPTAKSASSASPNACACIPTGYNNPSLPANNCTVNASAGNSWTRKVCSRSFVENVPVATCTAGHAATSPYYETTCPTATTTPAVGVESYMIGCGCNPTAPSTTCTSPATEANNYTASTCTGTTTGPTAVQTCVGIGTIAANPTAVTTTVTDTATSTNSWTSTTCTYNQTQALTYKSACTNPPFTNNATNGTTTANGNGTPQTLYNATDTTYYTCIRTTTGDFYTNSPGPAVYVDPTTPASSCGCTPAENGNCAGTTAASGNNYLHTRCVDVTSYAAPVTCTGVAESPSAGNNQRQRTCTDAVYNSISDTPVASCPSTSGPGALPAAAAYATNAGGGIWTGTHGTGSGMYFYTTSCNTSVTDYGVVDPGACGCSVSGLSGLCTVDAAAGNSYTTTTCNKSSVQTPVQSGTCTPAAAASGNGWVETTCPVTTNGPSVVDPATCPCTPGTNASCSVAGTGANSWTDYQCTDVTTGPTPVGTCVDDGTPDAISSPPWSTTRCDNTSSPLNTDNVAVQTCVDVDGAAATGPDYVRTHCHPVANGKKVMFETKVKPTTVSYSGGVVVSATEGAWTGYTAPAAFSQCQGTDAGSWPVAPADGRPAGGYLTSPTMASYNASCTSWPCLALSTTADGGAINTLADAAMYYYKTDLRPSGTTGYDNRDVSANKVPATGTDSTENDKATWQHMTTFTMGLGVSGNIDYNPDYKTKPIGTFSTTVSSEPAVFPAVGTVSLPIGTPNDAFQRIRCQDGSSQPLSVPPYTCKNWPAPTPNTATAVDDLWHAAVNGRGQYFSATDPDSVYRGLITTLSAIAAQSASGTAATTATQDPVPGNDLVFRPGFRTVDWVGDIRAQRVYTGSNALLEGTLNPVPVWSAQEQLSSQTKASCDNRTIHLFRKGATNNLTPFTWETYKCDGSGNASILLDDGLNSDEKNFFVSTSPTYTAPFSQASWTQFLNSSASQREAAQGKRLVNYLRGQKAMEGWIEGDVGKLFRSRSGNVLGDVIGSQPRYVREPLAQFLDTGYAGYKTLKANREPMLYVGANDGMLHAFKVGTSADYLEGGKEVWAIIPSAVLPNMWRLADTGYADSHTYFVDGTVTAEDVYNKHATVTTANDCASTTSVDVAKYCWRTIIAGGLNAGGRGYYAVDVTDPTTPKGLWEFKHSTTCYDKDEPTTHYADCHLGLSFGLPLITKLDGTWVVIVTSGLGNVNTTEMAGDGQGYLYVLDAITGKILKKVGTGVGSYSKIVTALTGTLSITSGSRDVTGTGTSFTTELVQGQEVTINNQVRLVQSITDNTHLVMSDAYTSTGTYGATKATGVGPAGLAFVNGYVEDYLHDNSVQELYGGDELGNVWRFRLGRLSDMDDYAMRLVQLKDPNGKPQPISTMPRIRAFGASAKRMVFVGTGRYLGESDLSDPQVQTMYGIQEDLNSTLDTNDDAASYIASGLSTPASYDLSPGSEHRSEAARVYAANGSAILSTENFRIRDLLNKTTFAVVSNSEETKVVGPETTTITTVTTPVGGGAATTSTVSFTTTPSVGTTTTTNREYSTRGATTVGCTANSTDASVSCKGWYVDLPDTGERISVHPQLVLGTIAFATTVPALSACDFGGYSWLNFLNSETGEEASGSKFRAGRSSQGAITVGVTLMRGLSGNVVAGTTPSSGEPPEVIEVPTQQAAPLGRRASWRNLLTN